MITLIDSLKQVKDFRTVKGTRHPLWLVLLLVIMATMSGYVGYRACGDFVKRHQEEIINSFNLPKARVPSYSTIRRVFMGVNYEELVIAFNNWSAQYASNDQQDWLSIDGKSLKNTVTNYNKESQDFVSIVSVFSSQRGLVLGLNKFNNKKTSEIHIVQDLIKVLDLAGIIFTFDALHTQKKL